MKHEFGVNKTEDLGHGGYLTLPDTHLSNLLPMKASFIYMILLLYFIAQNSAKRNPGAHIRLR